MTNVTIERKHLRCKVTEISDGVIIVLIRGSQESVAVKMSDDYALELPSYGSIQLFKDDEVYLPTDVNVKY